MPQPFITPRASTHKRDYEELGLKLTAGTRAYTLPSMAETGYQSCLVGIDTIWRLGLSWEHLIPVTMKMHTANSKGISILVAVTFRFSGKSKDGQALNTCQVTYITDNSDKLFLSREPCIGLGMISRSFPQIGELTLSATTNRACTAYEDGKPATSLRPSIPPAVHKQEEDMIPHLVVVRYASPRHLVPLPFPAKEIYGSQLEQFLLGGFKSSTFNKCTHLPTATHDENGYPPSPCGWW